MLVRRWRSAVVLGALWPGATAWGQLKAFPEAEGFGRFATGARTSLASASIYHVTNLNDSGAGSFRDAVSQSNRFVVFDVGGIARIDSVVTFASNITIAGQTAPGGFQVYGNRVAFHGANNLISRYWGARNAATNDNDAASLARGTNMMFDHMSITWGRDGTFDINPDSGQIIDNLTIQNTIIAQGLQASNHSTGGLMTLEEDRNFSIIKSLFADNKTRNPKARGNNEFINNVEYGWTEDGYIMGDTSNAIGRANAEGNYFIRGPLTSSHPFTNGTAQFQIYGNGNLYDSNQNGVADGTLVTSYPGATVMPSRHNFPTTSVMSAADALGFVLANVGPSITRDVVDTNLIAEVNSFGTLGGLINRETDIYPNYDTDPQYVKPRSRLLDTDGDSIPDNWETSRGYNPANGTDWKTLAPSGYTRLEEYLNELGGYTATRTATPGGTWSSAATWGGTVPTFADTAIVPSGVTHASGNAFARQLTLDGASSITGGTLDVFDTLLIGAGANGSLNLGGGTLAAGRIMLASTGRTGTLTVLPGGTLQLGILTSGGGTASLILDGGTLRALPAPSLGVPLTVNAAGGTIDTAGQNLTIPGNMSGAGTLTKSGAGTLTFIGNNGAYTGPINLNTGVISLAANAANSPKGIITLATNTTLDIAAGGNGTNTPMALANAALATLTGGTVTYNGAIAGLSNSTLKIVGSSTGSNHLSIGGSLAGFQGTLDFTNARNIRLSGAGVNGSADAKWVLGDSGAIIRNQFGGTVNIGSLTGGSTTVIQGATNNANPTTFVIGGNNNPVTTFSGTIANSYFSAGAGLTHLTKTGTGTLTLAGSANSYTGVTTLSGGVLSVASIKDGGVASSIGQSAVDAANLVFNGGTLRYTGATAQSSNRLFTLGASGQIDASSSNHSALAFTSAGSIAFTGIGPRALTLNGTSAGANTLAGAIGDGTGGGTAIVKSGSGTWNLTGNNTFTGGTTVQAGRLTVKRLQENNPVTLTGGTLQVISSNPTLPSHPAGNDAMVSHPSSLSISPGATLDLTNNDLILPYAGPSPASGIEALVRTGFHNGDWLGTGITSSTAASIAAGGNFVLAVADNASLPQPFGASNGGENFAGVDVPLDCVLIKFTHRVDLNLDGLVTDADAIAFSTNYEAGADAHWSIGDLNYDGTFSDDDAIIFNTYYDSGLQHLPEPLSGIFAIVMLSCLMDRRRR